MCEQQLLDFAVDPNRDLNPGILMEFLPTTVR